MTDLERALPELDSKWDYQGDDPIWTILFRWCKRGDNDVVRLFMRSDGPIHPLAQALTEALAAARREGAAEMRERAARLVFYEKSLNGDLDDVADAIRALPLTRQRSRHD